MTKKATPPKSDTDPVNQFEAALAELESIVARMEGSDLPLEESLTLFERGVALTKACRDSLQHAELRVKTLLADAAPDNDDAADAAEEDDA